MEGYDLILVIYKSGGLGGDRVGELVMDSVGNIKTLGT